VLRRRHLRFPQRQALSQWFEAVVVAGLVVFAVLANNACLQSTLTAKMLLVWQGVR